MDSLTYYFCLVKYEYILFSFLPGLFEGFFTKVHPSLFLLPIQVKQNLLNICFILHVDHLGLLLFYHSHLFLYSHQCLFTLCNLILVYCLYVIYCLIFWLFSFIVLALKCIVGIILTNETHCFLGIPYIVGTMSRDTIKRDHQWPQGQRPSYLENTKNYTICTTQEKINMAENKNFYDFTRT